MTDILVVEDNSSDCELIDVQLQAELDASLHFAESAERALEVIETLRPDLLLADLQLPGMSGLDLVRLVRVSYPAIPVVLMTGYGSEMIAVQALQAGAANYVPKSEMKQTLASTVKEVLALVAASRTHTRLVDFVDGCDFDFTLDNDPEKVPAVVDLIQQMMRGLDVCDELNRVRVAVALEEALLNAIYHGNLEIPKEEIQQASTNLLDCNSLPLAEERRKEAPYAGRKVWLRAEISRQEARFVVRDEGRGFDRNSLPDPSFPGALEELPNRGILLMESFMDEVSFDEYGRTVTFIKKSDGKQDSSAFASPTAEKQDLFELEFSDGIVVIQPTRRVSSFAEAEVRRFLADLLDRLESADCRQIIIDFADFEFFGSCMLETMRILAKEAKAKHLGVCNLSPVAREILELVKFDKVWTIHESRYQAVNDVGSSS